MEKESYNVRILSPIGTYPNQDIIFEDSALYIDDDICFSVSKFHEYNLDDGDEYYSEVEWLNPAEARLYGIVNIATDKYSGYSMFYPFPKTEIIDISKENFGTNSFKENTKAFLLDVLSEPCKKHPHADHQIPNFYQKCRDIPLPSYAGGEEYRLVTQGIDFELINQLYTSFNLNDNILVRGITALLKSRMLHEHYQFMEQSINSLFICMEVSYRLVLRKLNEISNKNPTSKEAMHFVHDVFNDTYRFDSYFEEYYENRIKTFHPENRFGAFPHAPLAADDYYHLYRDMNELYCYLISGYVHPRNYEKTYSS